MKSTCATYVRVSTEEQGKQYSPAAQLDDLRAKAKASGYVLPREFEFRDIGISGAILDRPGLTALRDQVDAGRIDVILIAHIDRLSRDIVHQHQLQREFEAAGVRVEYLTMPNNDTPEGQLLVNITGAFAVYEKDVTRRRSIKGRNKKAREGFIVGGRSPYGYQYLGKAQGERGKYVIDEQEAVVVQKMYDWLLDGISLREITVRLNREGIRPKRGTTWAKSSVRRIISSSIYAGVAHFNQRERTAAAAHGKKTTMRFRSPDQWIAIAVPAIVSEQTFLAGLERLRDNAERLRGRNTVNVYLLRGLVRCDRCGARLAGNPSHGRRQYRCINQDRLSKERCRAPLINADKLETFTWNVVTHCLSRPQLLKSKLNEFYKDLESDQAKLAAATDSLRHRLAKAQDEESRLLDHLVEELFDPAVVRMKAEQLRRRREQLQQELATAEHRERIASRVAGRDQQIEKFYRVAMRGLDALDMSGRQQFLRDLLDEVRISGKAVVIRGLLPGRVVKPAPGKAVKRTHHADDRLDLQPLAFVLSGSLDGNPEDLEFTVKGAR